MYINSKLLRSRSLLPLELIILQLIKQNKNEDQSDLIRELVGEGTKLRLMSFGLIDFVKAKNKSQDFANTIRTTTKGNVWLEDITNTVKVEEQDIIIFDWLKRHYDSLGKEIGSETKCKNNIAWFRTESGIEKNNLIILCQAFTGDENRMEYSHILEYIFYKPTNHFQTTKKLEDSKLWLYYEKRREYFDQLFKSMEK
jgi:hypothetical protein